MNKMALLIFNYFYFRFLTIKKLILIEQKLYTEYTYYIHIFINFFVRNILNKLSYLSFDISVVFKKKNFYLTLKYKTSRYNDNKNKLKSIGGGGSGVGRIDGNRLTLLIFFFWVGLICFSYLCINF